MKLKYLFISILVFCLATYNSCKKDSISEPLLVTDCFQFIDSDTNLPIVEVSGRLNCYDPNINSYYTLYFSTDTNGMFCWEHNDEVLITSWDASTPTIYENICNNIRYDAYNNIIYYTIPETILLRKAAYYKFIVKNIEPQSENDFISIIYFAFDCHNNTREISLAGSDIDTMIVRETNPGAYSVLWESTGANQDQEWIYTSTQSNDTTAVEIEY